jgi:hypothetical protein
MILGDQAMRSGTLSLIIDRFTIAPFPNSDWTGVPMRIIPFFVIFVLICSGLMAQAPAVPPKQVLFDFRNDRPVGPPKITGTERTVLAKVFRKYLTDESQCSSQSDPGGSDDPLKAARNAGQIVPSIVDVTTGSFTAPERSETAYVISVSECNASHADNFGTKRVAIFSGQQMIVNVDVSFRSGIVRKTDLNGDGMDELLMTTGDTNQGITIETAALLDFRNGRLRVIEDLGTISEDSCASEQPGSSIKASVVLIGAAAPGDMPKLRIDNYKASCRNPKRWRFLSTGKMPD